MPNYMGVNIDRIWNLIKKNLWIPTYKFVNS